MKKGLIFALIWMMAVLAGCGSHGSSDYKSAVMDSKVYILTGWLN